MTDDQKTKTLDLRAIRAAAERIRPYAHKTPVLTCTSLNTMVGAELFFKCENLQKVGAFKFRGAVNAAVLEGNLQVRDRRIGIILSGGNLDLDVLPWLKS